MNTAEEVLRALDAARARMGMSKAELARRGRLPPETVRRLLTSRKANPHFSLVADMLRPAGLGLFVGKLDVPAESAPADAERVQAWLAHLGAPLYGSTAVKASDVRHLNGSSPKRCRSPVMMRPWRARYRSRSTVPASASTSASSVGWRENEGRDGRSDSSSI